MRVECIAFTKRGLSAANSLARGLSGHDVRVACGFGPRKAPLGEWTARAWESAGALVFVGACGIAVRAVAPYVKAKTADPAVLVVDEGGRWVIPLLSGHVGGANRLARAAAGVLGAEAVVTTATDGRGLWAIDEWATRQGMAIANPERIKEVSGRLLAGEDVLLYSDVPIQGALPEGVRWAPSRDRAHAVVSFREGAPDGALLLVPRCVALGIGCRRGAGAEAIERAVRAALIEAGISPLSVGSAASIDVKADEAGLLEFCARAGLRLDTYSAEELSRVAGSTSSSDFVLRHVGVDNVCERAALAQGGCLVAERRAQEGVTTALACRDVPYAFEDAKAPCGGVREGSQAHSRACAGDSPEEGGGAASKPASAGMAQEGF